MPRADGPGDLGLGTYGVGDLDRKENIMFIHIINMRTCWDSIGLVERGIYQNTIKTVHRRTKRMPVLSGLDKWMDTVPAGRCL